MGKNHKVFALYETVPHDPHEQPRLTSIHKTMEGAQRAVWQLPLHPFGRAKNGVVEAEPLDGYTYGAKIIPMDLLA